MSISKRVLPASIFSDVFWIPLWESKGAPRFAIPNSSAEDGWMEQNVSSPCVMNQGDSGSVHDSLYPKPILELSDISFGAYS